MRYWSDATKLSLQTRVATVVLASLAVLAAGVLASQERQKAPLPDGVSLGYDHYPDFVAYDTNYPAMLPELRRQLAQLQMDMNRQQATGRSLWCARQLFEDANWKVNYTAHPAQAFKVIEALREVLKQPADPHPPEQQAASDGAFACCAQSWEMRMDESYAYILQSEQRGQKLPHHPAFLDRINSPEKLSNYLDSVLISDIRRDGIDRRKDLNLAITGLTRYILRGVPAEYSYHPQLQRTLLDYLDSRWQDPQTGYWGAWFVTANGLHKTADLSVTFHIVSFRKGQIEHWSEIIATTFAIKDHEYPYGWLQAGKMSNHYNYDVVRLFRLGWKHMSRAQRARASQEIAGMLQWCLSESLDSDGAFKRLTESTFGSAQNFGVKFLLECGYFDPAKRFWTHQTFPEAAALRQRLAQRLEPLKDTERELRETVELLKGEDAL